MRKIRLDFGYFVPEIVIGIEVPEDRDAEEYIDELLDFMLNENMGYNVDWEFVD